LLMLQVHLAVYCCLLMLQVHLAIQKQTGKTAK
jgi:hypothetical protein